MFVPGMLPPDLFTALAVLFLLVGVPVILFGLIMLYTGYVRYDAERFIAELEEEGAGDHPSEASRAEPADDSGETSGESLADGSDSNPP